MPATTIKLSDALKRRIAAVAKRSGKSPHAFVVEAIEQQTALAERRRQFVTAALAARKATLRSGLGYAANDVHAYIRARLKDKKAARPKARSWRG